MDEDRGDRDEPDEQTRLSRRRRADGPGPQDLDEDTEPSRRRRAEPVDEDTLIGSRHADDDEHTHVAIRRRVGNRPPRPADPVDADDDTVASGRRIGAELGSDTIRSRRRAAASPTPQIPRWAGRTSTDGHAQQRIYRSRSVPATGLVHLPRDPATPEPAGAPVDAAHAARTARRSSRRTLIVVVAVMVLAAAAAAAAIVILALV